MQNQITALRLNFDSTTTYDIYITHEEVRVVTTERTWDGPQECDDRSFAFVDHPELAELYSYPFGWNWNALRALLIVHLDADLEDDTQPIAALTEHGLEAALG